MTAAGERDTAGVLANIFGGKSDADRERVNQAMKTLEKMGDQAKQAGGEASNPQAAAANATARRQAGRAARTPAYGWSLASTSTASK